MKPVAESFCTIIAGQWNPNIFKPDWVKSNLAKDQNKPVEIAFPIGDPSLPPRVHFDDVFIFPSQSRLDIRVERSTKENLVSTTEAAVKCLELLTHTPVSALGINVAFSSNTADADSIVKLFSFEDDARIDSGEFKLQEAEIKRSFKFNDYTLNLAVSYNATDVKIDFNFNFESRTAQEAIQHIQKNPANELYDRAVGFLKTTYDLEIEA